MSISEIRTSLVNLERQVEKLTKNSWYWSKKKACDLASKVIQDVASYTKTEEGALFPKTKEKDAICAIVVRIEQKMESHKESGVFDRRNKAQSTTAKTVELAISAVKDCYPWTSTKEIETAIGQSFEMTAQSPSSSFGKVFFLQQMPIPSPKGRVNWSLNTEPSLSNRLLAPEQPNFAAVPPQRILSDLNSSFPKPLATQHPGTENISPHPTQQNKIGPEQIPTRTKSCFDLMMQEPVKQDAMGKAESPDDWSF